MSKATVTHTLAAAGIFMSLACGFGVIVHPAAIETKSHAFLVARVQDALANQAALDRSPERVADVQRTLDGACHYCSPRRPPSLTDDSPFEIQVAVREYSGVVLNLFIGILSVLTVNFVAVVLAFVLGFSRPAFRLCGTAITALAVLSDLGLCAMYLASPPAFHLVILRMPLDLAIGWGLVLCLFGAGCLTIHARSRFATSTNATVGRPIDRGN